MQGMTPEEFREALTLLDATPPGFGRLVGADEATAEAWVTGQQPIPPAVATVVRMRRERLVLPTGGDEDDDRSRRCREAIEPHLQNLEDHAGFADWRPAEVAEVVLIWAAQRIGRTAGRTRALHALEDAADLVRMQG